MNSKNLVNHDNLNKLAEIEKDLLAELFEGVSEVVHEVQNHSGRKTEDTTQKKPSKSSSELEVEAKDEVEIEIKINGGAE